LILVKIDAIDFGNVLPTHRGFENIKPVKEGRFAGFGIC